MRTTPFNFKKREPLEESSKKYDDRLNKLERLGIGLKQVLETFLQDNDIPYLAVSFRVKDKKSFLEKIERKKYSDPIEETEDLLGLRIICYYQSDVERICNILKEEFRIIESKDKVADLNDDQFGYRSYHNIVQIKKGWTAVPNFRGLEKLKAEIQVRTVLMHAWAEIEHKLAYKKEQHIGKQFRRKFSLISANLETADGQFELLKREIAEHIAKISAKAEAKGPDAFKGLEMNKDNLQAFLDYHFKNRRERDTDTVNLLDELIKHNITFDYLTKWIIKFQPYLKEIEKEIILLPDTSHLVDGNGQLWHKVGVVRMLLDIVNDKYYRYRYLDGEDDRWKIIKHWRETLM